VIFVGFVVATPTPTSLRTLAGTDVTWASTLLAAAEAVGPDFGPPSPGGDLDDGQRRDHGNHQHERQAHPEQHPATAGCRLPFLRSRGQFRGQPLPSG
jgi:hypothetical protein